MRNAHGAIQWVILEPKASILGACGKKKDGSKGESIDCAFKHEKPSC